MSSELQESSQYEIIAYILGPNKKPNLEKPQWVVVDKDDKCEVVSLEDVLKMVDGKHKLSDWFEKQDERSKVRTVLWREEYSWREEYWACFASTETSVVNKLESVGICKAKSTLVPS